ncbi:MAG: hypothetical protein Q9196_006079, partial [Gyalolechia fulgens]
MGYDVGGNPSNARRNRDERRGETSEGFKLLGDLIDGIIDSKSRSDLLETQLPLARGPLDPELRKQPEPATHHWDADKLHCRQFQRDVVE